MSSRSRALAYAVGCVAIFVFLTVASTPGPGEKSLRDNLKSIDSQIQAAKLQGDSAAVENLKILRADNLRAAGAEGISLSPLFQHAALVIAAAAAILALLITLLSKQVIDWPKLKAAREEFKALGKEIMAATRRGDVKQVHKLQPRYRQLSGEVMGATFKQMLILFIFYLVAWPVLGAIYTGWVVVWLPFGPTTWPLFGTVVSAGFFWWFILTYFGFSAVWRQLLIGEW